MKRFFKFAGLFFLAIVLLLIVFLVIYSNSMTVKSMVKYGGNLEHQDIGGWNALHGAAAGGDTRMIEYILDKGVDRNVRTGRGETAWHVAKIHGQSEAAGLLEQSGVDTTEVDPPQLTGLYLGQTPPGDTPEIFMPGIISGHYPAHSPCVFTPNRTIVYWTAGLPPHGGVEVMRRIGGKWRGPEFTHMKGEPSISPDGNRLFFISMEPLQKGQPGGDENIWVMDRTDTGWSEPVPLPPSVNERKPHFLHSVDKQGNLYFSTYSNMYYSEYRNGVYQESVEISVQFGNETLEGTNPFISPDGDFLMFTAHTGFRSDGLFISFKKSDGSWTDKISLGDEVNSGRMNFAPRLTPDGNYIFFVSNGNGRPWAIYWMSADIIDRLKDEHVGVTPPSAEFNVGYGTRPEIDGVFSPGEWDDARTIELGATRKIHFKHDGTHLYAAFSATGGNVYVNKNGRVYILHASYSLGWAEYQSAASNMWTSDVDYDWELYGLQTKSPREIHRKIADYLNTNGWTASLMPMGNPYETEYAISLEWLGITGGIDGSKPVPLPKIGIAHMSGTAARPVTWPAGIALSDSLNRGYVPAFCRLEASGWGDIYLDLASPEQD